MPSPAAIMLAARRVPWTKLLWLVREANRRGSAVWKELSSAERRRFLELVKSSRGRPDSLPARERDELTTLATRAWTAAKRTGQPPPAS